MDSLIKTRVERENEALVPSKRCQGGRKTKKRHIRDAICICETEDDSSSVSLVSTFTSRLCSLRIRWCAPRKTTKPGPPTRGIEQQKTASPVRGASTKRETEYQAARTLSRVELKHCSYQILWQRRPLFQPQHHSGCPTLGDLLRRGRDSSSRNTFVVLNVLQIQEPQRSHGSQPHVAHGSEAWWPAAHSLKRRPARCFCSNRLAPCCCVLLNYGENPRGRPHG